MVTAFIIALASMSTAQAAGVEHIVVIGVDGLSPAGIEQADTPHIDALMARGASTMHARAVMPTSSSSNWASMIMGAGPEQHGITSNDWKPGKHAITPVARGAGGIFPTIFSAVREQRPEAALGVFYDWGGFGPLVEENVANAKQDCEGPEDTVNRAMDFFAAARPLITFMQLDHVDHAGHDQGWGSEAYGKAVEVADAIVGRVVARIDQAGCTATTVVLVASDHGGSKKGHGGVTMEELEIPWIIAGPGVRQGHIIQGSVGVCDTAVTLAHILGVTTPEAWIGRPVREALAE